MLPMIKKAFYKGKNKGFSLIELVMTIMLTAFVFATVSIFMKYPILAYANVVNRGSLVDDAELAFGRMTIDLQNAVPNSVRVKTDPGNAQRIAVEFLNAVEGIPYVPTGTGAAPIPPNSSANSFMTLGLFQKATSNATCVPSPGAAGTCRLIVGNTTDRGVYSTSPVVITPVGNRVTFGVSGNQAQLTLDSAVLFANASPNKMLYVSDMPVTYICDASAKTLKRYWGYSMVSTQPTDPTVSPLSTASSAPLSTQLTSCTFSTLAATGSTYGILHVRFSFTNASETITLMRQIAVSNPL